MNEFVVSSYLYLDRFQSIFFNTAYAAFVFILMDEVRVNLLHSANENVTY